MTTLKQAYIEYLKTQVKDSVLEEDLSTNKYQCWSIPHQKEYTVQNWLGQYMGTGVIQSRLYVWLGNKGAVYVTKTPKFDKKDASDTSVHHDMKMWVWRKYFSIDFEEVKNEALYC